MSTSSAIGKKLYQLINEHFKVIKTLKEPISTNEIFLPLTLNLSALLRYKRCWYTKEGSLSIRWLFRDWRRRRNVSPSSLLLNNTGKSFGSVVASRCAQAPWSFLVLMSFITWPFSLNDLLKFLVEFYFFGLWSHPLKFGRNVISL